MRGSAGWKQGAIKSGANSQPARLDFRRRFICLPLSPAAQFYHTHGSTRTPLPPLQTSKARAEFHRMFRMKTYLPVFLYFLLAVAIHAQDKPAPAESPAPDAAAVGAAKKRIIGKVNQIIIPRISFREANVSNVLEFLQKRAEALDQDPVPSRRGVNLIFKPGPDIAPGNPAPPETKVTLTLINAPLGDALHYFAILAHLKVTIDSEGVVFESLPAGTGQKDDPLAPDLHGDNSALIAKLRSIVVPSIELHDATLRDGLYYLVRKYMEFDPNSTATGLNGLNFVIKPGPAPAPAPAPAAGGAPGAAPPPEPKMTLLLHNIPLSDAIHYAAILAGMKITVDPRAVVFDPLPAGAPPDAETALQPEGDAPVGHLQGGRKSVITAKLAGIVIPNMDFRDATVLDVVDFLRKTPGVEFDNLQPDLAKQGVNIILVPGPAPAAGATPPFEKKISMSVTNITFGEALRRIADLAGLKVTIDPNAVLLEPKPEK